MRSKARLTQSDDYASPLNRWAKKVKRLISDGDLRFNEGRKRYRMAAELIAKARAANPKITQECVAEVVGRSTTWVCRLLKWHASGCKDGSIFDGGNSTARIAPAQPKKRKTEVAAFEEKFQ